MDKQFFNLRLHWIVALIATLGVAIAFLFQLYHFSYSLWIFQACVITLFVQFVWSGAYSIASMLSGNRPYFFSLIKLSIYTLAIISVGILYFFK
ncbi:MAG: hypothetical protein RLZZ262_1337 [Bacteroidota bacterium]|jgi:hypothetical protein